MPRRCEGVPEVVAKYPALCCFSAFPSCRVAQLAAAIGDRSMTQSTGVGVARRFLRSQFSNEDIDILVRRYTDKHGVGVLNGAKWG